MTPFITIVGGPSCTFQKWGTFSPKCSQSDNNSVVHPLSMNLKKSVKDPFPSKLIGSSHLGSIGSVEKRICYIINPMWTMRCNVRCRDLIYVLYIFFVNPQSGHIEKVEKFASQWKENVFACRQTTWSERWWHFLVPCYISSFLTFCQWRNWSHTPMHDWMLGGWQPQIHHEKIYIPPGK